MDKETRGRKKIEDVGDIAKPTSVSLTPNEKKFIIKKFGSLNAAIKTLLSDEHPAPVNANWKMKQPPPHPFANKTKVTAAEPTMAELFKQMIRQK